MAAKKTRVSGAPQVQKNLKAAMTRWERAVAAGLYLAANNIMARSKRLVPVDLGALKGSGYVTLPEVQGNKIRVEIGYGGAAKDYAVIQHEHTEFQHPEGGQALYLSQAVDEQTHNLPATVQALARQAFAQGQGPTRGPLPTTPTEGG